MSSDMPSGSGYASPARSSSSSTNRRSSGRPSYMTVGSGSTSEAAARLTAMLDQDSGYGGSNVDGQGWNPGTTDDRFMPAPQPGGGQCEYRSRHFFHIHPLTPQQLKSSEKPSPVMSTNFSTTRTVPHSPAQSNRRWTHSRSCRI